MQTKVINKYEYWRRRPLAILRTYGHLGIAAVTFILHAGACVCARACVCVCFPECTRGMLHTYTAEHAKEVQPAKHTGDHSLYTSLYTSLSTPLSLCSGILMLWLGHVKGTHVHTHTHTHARMHTQTHTRTHTHTQTHMHAHTHTRLSLGKQLSDETPDRNGWKASRQIHKSLSLSLSATRFQGLV